MALVKFIQTTESKLSTIPVKSGQLIFSTDTRKIRLDTDDGRVEYYAAYGTRIGALEATNENILGLDRARNWTLLSRTADLDNVVDLGVYSALDGKEILHSPLYGVRSGVFVMTVSAANLTGSSIVQEIKYVDQDMPANTFRRTRYYDNIWGPWTVGPVGALDPNNRVIPGETIKGTTLTTTVPTASDTDVQSMTLPAGTYIITSGIQFTEAFTSSYNHQIVGFSVTEIPNPVYRGYGDRGGGDVITVTATLKGTRTLTVVVNQLSGSDKIVNRLNFTALRIA